MSFHPKDAWTAEPATLGASELLIMAKSMIAARKALHGPLPAELIHDPALDILLHLFVAHASHKVQTFDGLGVCSSVSASVFRRWVLVLQHHGFVDQSNEEVGLTTNGVAAVIATLRSVAQSQWHLEG